MIIKKAQNNEMTIQQQGKTFGQVRLLRIKLKELKGNYKTISVKSRKIQKQFPLMLV